MRFSIILAAALACASPAAAQPDHSEGPTVEAVAAEMVGYGQWLVRANETQAPVMNALQQIQGRWGAAMALRDTRAAAAAFRPFIAETVELIDRVNRQIGALPTPEFPALDLTPDLQTPTLARDMRRLNEQIRALIESYNPLLDAMVRQDLAAIQQAGRQMVGGLKLIFDSQILLARGTLAATPREDSTWEIQNLQLLYFSAGARIVEAFPHNLVAGTDRALANDLRDFATSFEATAAAGSTKIEEELTEARELLALAEREDEAASIVIFRRSIAVLEVDRAMFPVGRDMAAILRNHAARLDNGRITVEAINRVFLDLQSIRRRFDEILILESATLSGPG